MFYFFLSGYLNFQILPYNSSINDKTAVIAVAVG